MAKDKEFVCSPMTGRLLDASGAPAANVALRRTWSWRGKKGEDSTRTDSKGDFAFPGVPASRGLMGWLPQEEAVAQHYYAQTGDGSEFEILDISESGLKLNWETGGKPFKVVCHLGRKQGFTGFYWGTCELVS